MGVDSDTLAGWLAGYDKESITIGVVASHSHFKFYMELEWKVSEP